MHSYILILIFPYFPLHGKKLLNFLKIFSNTYDKGIPKHPILLTRMQFLHAKQPSPLNKLFDTINPLCCISHLSGSHVS